MDNRDLRIDAAFRALAHCGHAIHTKAGHSDMACFRCGGTLIDPTQKKLVENDVAYVCNNYCLCLYPAPNEQSECNDCGQPVPRGVPLQPVVSRIVELVKRRD